MDASQWRERLGADVFQGTILSVEAMRAHTTLGIGGPADAWIEPADPMSFRNVLMMADEAGVDVTIVGAGSNVLVRDGGIRGTVVSTAGMSRVQEIRAEEGAATLFAEAGVGLGRLLSFCAEQGMTGIEGLAGIPGSLGGALRMNAGSYGTEIAAVVDSVALLTPEGRLYRVEAKEIEFGYRETNIPDGHAILSANLSFGRDEPGAVAERIRSFLSRKKEDQPLDVRSAGSVFRNPPGTSAWRLIDDAGFRGAREGGITVSEHHANFFVNGGDGTAADFLRLVERVRSGVQARSGIALVLEVHVLGVES